MPVVKIQAVCQKSVILLFFCMWLVLEYKTHSLKKMGVFLYKVCSIRWSLHT